MSRISTLSSNNQLVKLMLQSQERLQTKQVQISSEKKSQIYTGIAKDTQRLISIENLREVLNNFTNTNNLMDMRLSITETVLDGIDTTLSDFRTDLTNFNSTSMNDVNEIKDIQNSAFIALQNIESYLNTDVNGEFIFSGGRVTTQPVDFGLTNLADLQTKWDGSNVTYPTYRDNNIYPKMTASTGYPSNPTGAGFTDLSFVAGAGGTITTANVEAQVDAITLSGSIEAGDVYSATINGTTVTYTVTGSEANINEIRDNFVTAINANATASTFVTAAASAQVDNLTLAGVYAAGDTVSVNVNGIGAVVYTVVANDLTADGAGGGGTVAGDSTAAFNNITTKIAAAIAGDAPTALVVTAAASGSGTGIVTLTSTTAGTTFTQVSSATTAGTGTATKSAVVVGASGEITLTSDTVGNAFTTSVVSNGLSANAQVDNLTLAGVYAAGDTVSVNVNGIGAVVYTIVGDDLTANGDGTGGAVLGDSAAAFNNITAKIVTAIAADSSTAAAVTAPATGSGTGIVTLTSTTAGTAFTQVSSATTAGTGTATGSTVIANLSVTADNAASVATSIANVNAFANIPVGSILTISGANTATNDGTYTVASNTAGVITVSSSDTIAATDANDAGLTMISDITYYQGDETTQTHSVNKSRDFNIDLNALDPAFEKAIRGLFIIAQGVTGTAGGLDQNTGRVADAIYLVDSSIERAAGGTAPYGTELTGNVSQVRQDIAFDRVLIDRTNTTNISLVAFYDDKISGFEDVDPLDVYTGLLAEQNALEASYQAMARIRQLSLSNFMT